MPRIRKNPPIFQRGFISICFTFDMAGQTINQEINHLLLISSADFSWIKKRRKAVAATIFCLQSFNLISLKFQTKAIFLKEKKVKSSVHLLLSFSKVSKI